VLLLDAVGQSLAGREPLGEKTGRVLVAKARGVEEPPDLGETLGVGTDLFFEPAGSSKSAWSTGPRYWRTTSTWSRSASRGTMQTASKVRTISRSKVKPSGPTKVPTATFRRAPANLPRSPIWRKAPRS
jgi:hypothetical protein